MKKLDIQLLELSKEISRKQKIRIHLKHLYEVIEKRRVTVEKIYASMDMLQEDINHLEQLNLHSIFLFILGNKKEQLEKKRQDNLQLYLRLQALKDNLITLNDEKEVLERTYSSLHNIDQEFEQLLAKKEQLLKEAGQYPEALNIHLQRIAGFTVKAKEIEVVIKKGFTAKKHLHKVVLGLEKIDQWGSEERQAKANKQIERINRHIYVANNYLQKYEDELFEISDHFDLDYKREVESLEHFLDQFIDSLITDWIVRNQIDHSLNLVLNIMDKITRINSMFEREREEVTAYIDEEERLKAETLIKLIKKGK